MPELLEFSRNRCTAVAQVDDHTLSASCRLQDTYTDAVAEITVRLPDLEIVDVRGEVRRSPHKIASNPFDGFQKVKGVRIGPGMKKIIRGLVGKGPEIEPFAFMVEECCHGVILSFTKDELARSPRPKELEALKKFYADMVKENIRLYNRCAAFAPGSSLVEGIDPLTKDSR